MNVSAFEIKDRYETLIKDNTVYSYLGSFRKKEFNQVLKGLEEFVENRIDQKLTKKKLFHILIEITQNLHNYTKDKGANKKFGKMFFVVDKEAEDYIVTTGNFLLTKEIPGIRTRIEMVNAMSEKEVKELYRGILNFGGISNRGGAGLGFVDLVRRSGHHLIYKFEEIDDKFSFFTLQVNVTN